jgi:hypothetical protein
VPHGSRSQTVQAALFNAPFWSETRILRLTQNMRLFANDSNPSMELEQFSRWLLQVGDGRVDNAITSEVNLPPGTIHLKSYYLPIELCIFDTTTDSASATTTRRHTGRTAVRYTTTLSFDL